MSKLKRKKFTALMTALVMILASLTMSISALADNALDTPADLVLNRGHIETLAFGGPMGLSWGEVENRETFTVFVFTDENETDLSEAYAYVDGIDALYLDVNIAFENLTEGPFWFRVQAAGDDEITDSALSVPMGPFWYSFHSDEFADDPEGAFAIFENPEIPVIVIDTRRYPEREEQGNVVGDVHVRWPNMVAAEEEGVTHADFQAGVLAVWEDFIENYLTDEQRENLDPQLEYRDIHIFIY